MSDGAGGHKLSGSAVRASTLPFWLAALCAAQFAAPAAAADVVLASIAVGECSLSIEVRTQEPQVLRVRTFHPRYRDCQVDRAALVSVVAQALTEPAAGPAPLPYSAIAFGRLVEHPWLSTYLARSAAADPRWNPRTGKPTREDINRFVAELLSRPAVTDALQPALAAGGYRIAHVSVEKVLVGPAREIPGLGDERGSSRLPFDAILWFRLRAR